RYNDAVEKGIPMETVLSEVLQPGFDRVSLQNSLDLDLEDEALLWLRQKFGMEFVKISEGPESAVLFHRDLFILSDKGIACAVTPGEIASSLGLNANPAARAELEK